jgi:hypothetical protein
LKPLDRGHHDWDKFITRDQKNKRFLNPDDLNQRSERPDMMTHHAKAVEAKHYINRTFEQNWLNPKCKFSNM